jgi:prolyl-tRNA editing enzyme YbaK/EbsC (Cys-tRNA(Pro) deacylase)
MNDLTELENLLKQENVDYTIYQDNFSMKTAAEGAQHYGITLDETTPTLILKTKDKFYAAIICGSTRISFKKLKEALGIKEISMADPETILNLTGANIGEISLINRELTTLIDNNVIKNQNCYGGSGAPKTTLRINTSDLLKITKARVLDFTDTR